MFVFHRPDRKEIDRFIDSQRELTFTYPRVGTTKTQPPEGYTVDHNRCLIGRGVEDFEKAKSAVRQWKMFDFEWITLCWTDTPIEVGEVVAIMAHHLGFHSLNASRIVYTIDDDTMVHKTDVQKETSEASNDTAEGISRFGFAYGTLPNHAESGEERFSVEFDLANGAVTYDVFAFSQPSSPLIKLGYPFARHLQRRFAVDSMQSMLRAVGSGSI